MLHNIFLYLYRVLAALVVVVFVGFSLIFLATNPWHSVLGQAWFTMSVDSLNLFQVMIERYLHLSFIWNYVIVPWLQLPIWLAVIALMVVMAIKLWVLRWLFSYIL